MTSETLALRTSPAPSNLSVRFTRSVRAVLVEQPEHQVDRNIGAGLRPHDPDEPAKPLAAQVALVDLGREGVHAPAAQGRLDRGRLGGGAVERHARILAAAPGGRNQRRAVFSSRAAWRTLSAIRDQR
jgi:hypothetical protein